ncbi:hypothetical protein [Pseudoalteromonas aurantia]|uniref:hypothetical protein n=1 Tax=Pseudoalteromonas aurantia TaxID=43654 RepID=UPI001787E93B|nr:hypothetical protein [Pseudoalteromonas aurantia]
MLLRIMRLSLLRLSGSSYAGWKKNWGTITQVMSHGGIQLIYTTITDKTCGQTGNFWRPKCERHVRHGTCRFYAE